MKRPQSLTAKLKNADIEIKNYVVELEKENLKLQKQVAKLQVQCVTYQNEAAAAKKRGYLRIERVIVNPSEKQSK